MFDLQARTDKRAKLEDTLLGYYPRLIGWALQLTRRDYAVAEDLVQDLYLRFTRLDIALDHIENLENYLFLVLRNLYYAHLRRARTSAIDDLAIAEHETLDHCLRAVDHHELAFVRADLERICDFLCERKNASRSASILLLRYFLGYFPSEVMRLLKTTRISVDKAMQAARREARLALNDSAIPRRTSATANPQQNAFLASDDPQHVFLALRTRIFHARAGECFLPSVLKQYYAQTDGGFTTEETAHLVSCPKCLDQANKLLGLPLLAERSPDETVSRNTPQGPGGGAAANGKPMLVSSGSRRLKEDSGRIRRRMERRIREAMEHRPERLYITVDGDVRASQRVTAPLSELQVELGRHETPTYIEVLSEHSICIAFLLVRTPNLDRELNQVHEMSLSDGRTIKVVISFSSESPVIEVVYCDPLIGLEGEDEETEVSVSTGGLLSLSPLAVPAAPARNAVVGFLQWIRSWALRIPTPKMNPLFATAVFFGLASILCFVLWTRSAPRVSSAELLRQAEVWDTSAPGSSKSGVIYQKVRISTDSRVIERTIYRDPSGKRRPRRGDLSLQDQRLKESLERAGVNWSAPLSVGSYQTWHDRQRPTRDTVTRSGDRLLTLTTAASNDEAIIAESLTVRESDFHPIRRTVETRDAGTIEIAELNYDMLPWSAVNPDWFAPSLSSPSVSPLSNVHPRVSVLPHIRVPLTEEELDEADLSVRLVLNQLGADTGERITEVRTAQGLLVKGAVATEERKREIETKLISIPHVTPAIFTFSELESRPQGQDAITSVAAVSDAARSSALEDYLVKQGHARDGARQLSEELLDASLAIDQNSRALAVLLRDFGDGKASSPAAQAALGELLKIHKTKLLAAAERQTSLIAPLGSAPGAAAVPSGGDGDLESLASRDFALCKLLSRSDDSAGAPVQRLLEELAVSAQRLSTAVRYISATHLPGDRHDSANGLQPDHQR